MNLYDLLLIVTAVVMAATAQLALKVGMSANHVSEALAHNRATEIVIAIATSPYAVGGLFLYGLGAIIWLFVLAKLDVSLAYPFVGMGFVVTMFLGMIVLGEQVTLSRFTGTLLICAGCILVARTA